MSIIRRTKTHIVASPLARYRAKEHHLDLVHIKATGPNGRIINRDIESALKNQSVVSQLPDPRLFFMPDTYEIQDCSPMKRAVAQRLTMANSEIPHYYMSMECRVDAVGNLRKKFNNILVKYEKNEKITLNDFIIHAVASALMDVPAVNVAYAGDVILRYKHADISIAVALADGGLITPIIKQADTKSVRAIACEVKALVKRAHDLRLKPTEYEGGTFTISNLGMFGVSHFTAIINPPQAAIMAVGAVKESLVQRGGQLETHKMITVTLSSDHRVINGADAAKFLSSFRQYLEYPLMLFL